MYTCIRIHVCMHVYACAYGHVCECIYIYVHCTPTQLPYWSSLGEGRKQLKEVSPLQLLLLQARTERCPQPGEVKQCSYSDCCYTSHMTTYATLTQVTPDHTYLQ